MSGEEIKKLKRENEEYRTIFDNSPLMIWFKDREGRHIRVNSKVAELEGLPVSEIEGKTHWQLYPQEQADAFYADDLEVIETGQPKTDIIEAHTSPALGQTVWLRTSKVPYREPDGEITGVIVFAIDITTQIELKHQIAIELNALERMIEEKANPKTILEHIRLVKDRVEQKKA